LLAERLCDAADDLLAGKRKVRLFYSKVNHRLDITKERFPGTVLGAGKYRQYLNYFYGVTVEDALLLSVKR